MESKNFHLYESLNLPPSKLRTVTKITKNKKPYTSCLSVEDFIAHWAGAGRRELKQALKNAGGNFQTKVNERDAITALLA